MAVTASKKLPIDQYLSFEQEGEVRYEYHAGEVYAMAGGTINHTILSSNALRLLGNALQRAGKNCLAVNSDIKIEIERAERHVYPDAAVIYGKINESDTITGAVRNPRVIVEVISETSADYDRGAKMRYYLSLPTVKAYLLIDQNRVHATLYRRHEDNNFGSFHYADGLEATIDLQSIGVSLSMTELYRNVSQPYYPEG
ncbi:Uma2 family endonuclease [Neolewinella xylanilytica]|uniref:Uma2 family endonuclease n=1 Tax=Neolewinella xylanilytica TaxID=1514080 RepID=A0A2S6I0W0_9BACT|nr:Uma2 family endonuclease [Neolewinella xylanilytica]PPK84407.1 Uma2 family endonuclease [Neolewinella xylanilytica]